jgi:hypothetical protein
MIKYPDYYSFETNRFKPKDYLFPIPARDALLIGQNPGYE